ncbi:hypothetical protein [Natronospira bacteriovora]|uniref:Uncharacterized protein n=1 Tax=Natronospira bacteriovora TaxID=3069753 RepID=A0ABU0W6I4_9GAMM|nr:hypothetical protein [Natronospira sp. AB-CW4]MDQ2069606.1 hypothetical protein [Natronospira sp. AB-CW4]
MNSRLLFPAFLLLLILLNAACNGTRVAESPPAATSPHLIELPPLTAEEREALTAGDKLEAEPPLAGIGRKVPEGQQLIDLATLEWTRKGDHRTSRFAVRSPGASGLRLGLKLLNGRDCGLQLRFAGEGEQPGEAISAYMLRNEQNIWWSPVTQGEVSQVWLTHAGKFSLEGCAIRVEMISHLY